MYNKTIKFLHYLNIAIHRVFLFDNVLFEQLNNANLLNQKNLPTSIKNYLRNSRGHRHIEDIDTANAHTFFLLVNFNEHCKFLAEKSQRNYFIRLKSIEFVNAWLDYFAIPRIKTDEKLENLYDNNKEKLQQYFFDYFQINMSIGYGVDEKKLPVTHSPLSANELSGDLRPIRRPLSVPIPSIPIKARLYNELYANKRNYDHDENRLFRRLCYLLPANLSSQILSIFIKLKKQGLSLSPTIFTLTQDINKFKKNLRQLAEEYIDAFEILKRNISALLLNNKKILSKCNRILTKPIILEDDDYEAFNKTVSCLLNDEDIEILQMAIDYLILIT